MGWMTSSIRCATAGAALALWVMPCGAQTVALDRRASAVEGMAAREVQRYVYLRTGRFLPVRLGSGQILVARKDRDALASLPPRLRHDIASLRPQEYLLRNVGIDRLVIVGGDDSGVLYGAYRFAEKLGVRFYLHGDVIPDGQIPFRIPKVSEVGRPLFAIRGINPFHDFPEGPDWWNRDDYLGVIAQLPKLRMNFIGLHTYPEGGVGPEPEVWIGQKSDLDAAGRVKFSYPSSWANTMRPGSWGYVAARTRDFSCGTSQLFASDAYGPAVMQGMMPRPGNPQDSNRLFNDAGEILRDAFAEARSLGVKTCIGTETPLTIPRLVQDRLRAQGKDPASPEVVRSLYQGMFTRIERMTPVDYYWLWTPENWTWSGNTPQELARTTDDLRAALDALASIGNPYRLATCGWVLGPQNDRAALDRLLPKSVAVSTINQSVGNAPVEPGFGKISGRSKWAIPWMENDPALTAPQLWVGRMLYDAADARRLGCDGLIGIHWRTKILAPNVAALASAAWNQSWKPAGFDRAAAELTARGSSVTGAIGGDMSQFAAPVAGTTEQAIYQTVRYNMDGYDIRAPKGIYSVTLKFNEPFYSQAGKRVFGVKVQGKTVIDRLDVFERVGQNRAIDFTFSSVVVNDGHLRVGFERKVEFPCIAGIVVSGPGFSRKINCGGRSTGGYVGELDTRPNPNPEERGVPTVAFYQDFARANFGESVAKEAGALFARIDGMKLPRPATWITGPGDIVAKPKTTEELNREYKFVNDFEGLRSRVRGKGNLERFDYWLHTFRYMRCMALAGSFRAGLDEAIVGAEADHRKAELALRFRLDLALVWESMMSELMATVSTPGDLGTISNLEQHVRMNAHFLDAHDAVLAKCFGSWLPDTVRLSNKYRGPSRIVVPTIRTLSAPGERLTLDVLLPSASPTAGGTLFWRKLGSRNYSAVPLTHVARSVYRVALPANRSGLEYYIEARFGRQVLRFPPTAPAVGQTVVVGVPRAN